MKRLFGILSLLLVFALVFTSCKKKDNNQNVNLVEDGYYLVGGSAPIDSMVLKNMLEQGYVEGEGFAAVAQDGLYQKYVYLTANGGGFVIKQQAGAQRIVWGMDGNWTQVRGDTVMKAAIKQDGGNFTVPKDGLYLVVVDFPRSMLYMLRVEKWSVIGDATDGGWSDDSQQEMTEVSLDKDGGQWKIENLSLRPANFKFRFNHWWTYYFADTAAEANGDPKFFTNLGGSLDELTPGGANIQNDVPGIYTVTLNYTYGGKFTATLEKTGDLNPDDISGDTISIIGGGIGYRENGQDVMVAGWSEDIDMTYQGENNYVYTFVRDSVILPAGSEFKLRKNHDWGTNWGAGNTTTAGDNQDISGTDNFVSNSNKIYKLQFDYNGLSFAATLTFTYEADYVPPSPATHTFSLIGSAFYSGNDPNNSATNWDEDIDLTYDSQDANGNYLFKRAGVYFIGGGEFKVRKDHDWGTSWGYSDLTITGDGASNMSDNGGNIKVGSDAQYDVTFSIDGDYANAALDLTATTK